MKSSTLLAVAALVAPGLATERADARVQRPALLIQ
jgi:hypothetical protein